MKYIDNLLLRYEHLKMRSPAPGNFSEEKLIYGMFYMFFKVKLTEEAISEQINPIIYFKKMKKCRRPLFLLLRKHHFRSYLSFGKCL